MSLHRVSISPLSSRRQSLEHTPSPGIPVEDYDTSRTPLHNLEDYPNVPQGTNTHVDNQKHEEYEALQTSNTAITRKNRLLQFDWWWELSAVLLALLSTGAIIAVLAYADGKAVLEWPYSIQPASLVAIFSTIAKSALLVPLAACLSQMKWMYFERPRALSHMQDFEDASRGPWGAMLLLWKLKGTALLATAAAMATVLMLAFDPLTQQIIRFETRSSVMTVQPRQNATYKYETGRFASAQSLSDLQYFGGAEPGPEVRLQTTIGTMTAMAGQTSRFQSSTHCPTSNCSFDDFTTLGACSVCESEELLVNEDFGCEYYIRQSDPRSSRRIETAYTTLRKFTVAAKKAMVNNITGYGMNCSRTKEGFPGMGLTFEVDMTGNTTYIQGLGQESNKTSAHLSSDAIFGESNATYMGTVDLSPDGELIPPLHLSRYRFCTSGFGRKGLGGNSEDFDTIDTFTCFLTSHPGLYGTALHNLEELDKFNTTLTHCRLSFCGHEYKNASIQNGVTEVGSITKKPLKNDGSDPTSGVLGTIENSEFRAVIGPKSLAYLANSIELVAHSSSFQGFIKDVVDKMDWAEAFERIATMASDYVRSMDNPDAGFQLGQVHAPETFIRVHWEWISFPLLLLAMSIAVLLCTIVGSSGQQLALKHSILAPILPQLVSGRSVELQTVAGGKQTSNELLRSASSVRAIIVKDEVGRQRMERSR